MTTAEEFCQNFEQKFEHWEKHRMYPPSHTGESMISVNDSHLRAIARAVHFVRSGMSTKMTVKMINLIQVDIDKLDEVHKYIRQQISEPGLPMSPEKVGQGNNGEKDGDKDTKPAN